MQYPSRRADLKTRTTGAHEALDKLIGPFDSVPAYGRYLRGMAAFRFAIEDRLARAGWPDAFCALQPVPLGHLVEADLADLGAVAERPGLPASWLSRLGPDELLGVLYVLEGSALGARLLFRRAQALGFGEAWGARHLAVQSQQGGRWGAFLTVLEQAPDMDMARVADGALQTFKIAERAFERAFYEHEQA